eukprot:207854_1
MSESRKTFPTIPEQQILRFMKEIQIPLTRKQLQHPTIEVVEVAYTMFLEKLSGYTDNDLGQPNLLASEVFDHGQLHQDSVPKAHFYNALTELLNASSIHDFSPKQDILRPTRKRFQRNLSALINYEKFFDTADELVDKYERKKDAATLELNQFREQADAMKMELDALKSQYESESSARVQAEAAERKHSRELHTQKTAEAAHRANIESLKGGIKDREKQKVDLDYGIRSANLENANVQDTIVQSPERLQRTMGKLGERIKQRKDEKQRLVEQKKDVLLELEVKQGAHKKISKRLEMFRARIAAIEEIEKESRSKKDNLAEIMRFQKVNESLKEDLCRGKKALKSEELRMKKLNKEYNVKKQHNCQLLLEKREKSRGEERRTQKLDEDVRALESEIVRFREEHDSIMQNCESEKSGMEEQLGEFNTMYERFVTRVFGDYKDPWTREKEWQKSEVRD